MALLSKSGKVVHLTSVHAYTEDRIMRECVAAAAGGFEVHLIAHQAPDDMIQGVRLHGIEPVTTSFKDWVQATAVLFTRRALELAADIYHIHNPELLVAGEWLKRHEKRVVYDLHEDYLSAVLPREKLNRWQAWRRRSWFRRIEDRVLTKLDLIVGPQWVLLEKYHHQGCLISEICDYWTQAEIQARRYDFAQRERAACYFGELGTAQGLFTMIQAAAEADCKLILIGPFLSAQEQREAQALPEWRLVQHHEWLELSKLREILQRVAVGLVAYQAQERYLDKLPYQVGYYLSAGLPVLASDFVPCKEEIELCRCGFCINPADSNAWGGALRWLLHHEVEAAEMVENGKEPALDKYCWEAESRKLVESYRVVQRGAK